MQPERRGQEEALHGRTRRPDGSRSPAMVEADGTLEVLRADTGCAAEDIDGFADEVGADGEGAAEGCDGSDGGEVDFVDCCCLEEGSEGANC